MDVEVETKRAYFIQRSSHQMHVKPKAATMYAESGSHQSDRHTCQQSVFWVRVALEKRYIPYLND